MMRIKTFESYLEDEGILRDIFSRLEEDHNISIDVEKIFLQPIPHSTINSRGIGKPSFVDIFDNIDDPYVGTDTFFKNVSRLLPDSIMIKIRRSGIVPYHFRNIPFYIVRMDLDSDLFSKSDPTELTKLASEYGFLQIYDSRTKFRHGNKIKRILAFYHESYVGM